MLFCISKRISAIHDYINEIRSRQSDVQATFLRRPFAVGAYDAARFDK